MPMFNTNLYSNDGSVLYGNDGSYDFGFTITINKNSVGTGFSYAENGATIDSGNLNLPFDILGLTLTKGKQTPDDGLYVGDTDSQYDGLKNGELNLYVVPVPDIKTVSSENLARFKAKCDETYQKKGESGGITNAEVIEYAETLPTASETSPNFIQTPDGTLYRKKAVEGSGLLGVWIINSTNDGIATGVRYNVNFTSNGNSYTSMSGRTGFYPGDAGIRYDGSTVYTQTSGWNNENLRTINITEISELTDVDEFTQWLTANATGGGASVSYEYVAMQEVPTPTTADNGKVLGVTNGAYALQEASGGGGTQLYLHKINTDEQGAGGTYLYFVSTYSQQFSTFEDFFDAYVSPTSTRTLLSAGGTFKMWGDEETDYVECILLSSINSNSVLIYVIETKAIRVITKNYLFSGYGAISYMGDTVTPL